MTDVTEILSRIEIGESGASEQLLPLVYDELRKLAVAKLRCEKPGQTLQATALVHEVYLRLVDTDRAQHWDSRGHFFAAAAESMRRILVQQARSKSRQKRGGHLKRHDLDHVDIVTPGTPEEIMSIDKALERLEAADPPSAQVVKLRFFVGMTIPETAEALGVSPRKVDKMWAYAKSFLQADLEESG